MDAVTLVAAAVAVAVDNSRQAALNDLLLERERAAMHAAYLESHAAQRAYVGDQQLPRPEHAHRQMYTRTWRDAHMLLENASIQSMNRMASVGVANARGDVNLVAQLVREELGVDPPPPAETFQQILTERGDLLSDLQIARDAMRGVLRQLEARRVTMRFFDAEHMLAAAIDDASEALSSFEVEAAPEA